MTAHHLDEANPVPPHLATRFRDCFSPSVINVDPRTKQVSVDKHGVCGESMSREAREVLYYHDPDPAEFHQACVCTGSLHLCVHSLVIWGRGRIF